MTETSISKDRRAQLAAWVGLVFQTVFTAVLLTVGAIFDSEPVFAIGRWTLGGMIIWPVIGIIYGQRRRTAEEKREAEELKRQQQTGGTTAIFDTEDEAYLIERRRLNWYLRWVVPGAALVLAAYHLVGTFLWWSWDLGASVATGTWGETSQPGLTMAFVGGVGFLAFLFSRYTAGMARVPTWRMLRSGASYLAGNALACLIVLIALGLQGHVKGINTEAIAAYAIRITMLLLGIEFLANYILDFYRPRAAGQESRPAFDSRFLAIITEPGSIARSVADAINYQFGFEVSSTWFYQLLKRALLPMLAFGLVILFLLSSVVIVDADERAIIERFGLRLQKNGETLGPGPHLKAPWPIDKVYRARVTEIQELTVGDAPTQEELEEVEGRRRPKPILWGEKHEFNTEMMLIVASPELTDFRVNPELLESLLPQQRREQGRAVSVGLLLVSVDVQYCIDDLHDYLYEYLDPEEVVEAIAYQILTSYAASVDVDQFLGPGRSEVSRVLHETLQRRMDELDLGIRVLFVALQDAHPSDTVAKAFQEVVKAEREKDTYVRNARGMAQEILTQVAGSRERALLLDEAIVERDALARKPDAPEDALKAAQQRVEDLLMGTLDKRIPPTGGEAAQRIAEARAEVQEELIQVRQDETLYHAELKAFRAAPRLYKVDKYLDMLERSLEFVRKYVIVADPDTRVIVEFEKEEKGTIDLGELEQ